MRLAIQGGTPVRTKPFPSWPVYGEPEERALIEVLRSGAWGTGGSAIAEFEARFARFQDAKHATCVVNGTVALELALRAVGVGLGDEVILPPYTFVATATAVLALGAIPVFADVDADTYLLDPRCAEAAVTPRTRAIVAVHVAGCPADMDELRAVARRHGLKLVEDAAQAHGAAWRGRRVGALGDLGCFSFQSSKNLCAGEGGAVVTDDDRLAEVVWSLHNVGRVRGAATQRREILGTNSRMTQFQAALLLAQMQRLPDQIARREANGGYLASRLAEIPGIRPLLRDDRVTTHAWHLFVFRYEPEAFGGMSRDDFVKALRAEGIPCSPGYVPLHHSPAVRAEIARLLRVLGHSHQVGLERAEARLPVAERAGYQEGIWLTQNVLLGEREDLDDVVEAIAKIQRTL